MFTRDWFLARCTDRHEHAKGTFNLASQSFAEIRSLSISSCEKYAVVTVENSDQPGIVDLLEMGYVSDQVKDDSLALEPRNSSRQQPCPQGSLSQSLVTSNPLIRSGELSTTVVTDSHGELTSSHVSVHVTKDGQLRLQQTISPTPSGHALSSLPLSMISGPSGSARVTTSEALELLEMPKMIASQNMNITVEASQQRPGYTCITMNKKSEPGYDLLRDDIEANPRLIWKETASFVPVAPLLRDRAGPPSSMGIDSALGVGRAVMRHEDYMATLQLKRSNIPIAVAAAGQLMASDGGDNDAVEGSESKRRRRT